MYVILPFVEDFYKKYDYKVDFVGHPLIDAIENRKNVDEAVFRKEHNLSNNPIIALLPGSRKQEINKMLAIMLSVTDEFAAYEFVIAGAPSQEFEFYKPFLKKKNINFISHAAIVTSGTATLETALFKVPQVVCYKANAVSYQIARRIITLKYISLVNLIMDKEVVKELIQGDLNTKQLKKELNNILTSPKREEILKNYELLQQKLGGKGASEKTAHLIYKRLKK
jgi:lipid-A-disaccharide synthase